MLKTPNANRKHIAIYGNTNAGKSSLINGIIGQEVSIVSEQSGTTTDPVSKAMELIPFGPVVFVDTAGLKDESELGKLRIEKSYKVLQRTDFAIYVIDGGAPDLETFDEMQAIFKKYHIPYLTVVNKLDLIEKETKETLQEHLNECLFISTDQIEDILQVKDTLIQRLEKEEEEPPIIGDLLPYNSTVVMVVPIDSEAPKGRIILPQVQLIRDCLDHGIKSYVVRDTELEDALADLGKVDLVVTDSQAFKKVSKIVPDDIMLTSFSILFARYKGDLDYFVQGIEAIKQLQEGSNVLISESCTHNFSHEDIGRVKIPKLLQKKINKNLNFTFQMGHDFPQDLSEFDLIIHCGSCMLNKKTMMTRIQLTEEQNTPMTNYGVVLAYVTDILERSIQIFNLKN